jgi:hypothetical protein
MYTSWCCNVNPKSIYALRDASYGMTPVVGFTLLPMEAPWMEMVTQIVVIILQFFLLWWSRHLKMRLDAEVGYVRKSATPEDASTALAHPREDHKPKER